VFCQCSVKHSSVKKRILNNSTESRRVPERIFYCCCWWKIFVWFLNDGSTSSKLSRRQLLVEFVDRPRTYHSPGRGHNKVRPTERPLALLCSQRLPLQQWQQCRTHSDHSGGFEMRRNRSSHLLKRKLLHVALHACCMLPGWKLRLNFDKR